MALPPKLSHHLPPRSDDDQNVSFWTYALLDAFFPGALDVLICLSIVISEPPNPLYYLLVNFFSLFLLLQPQSTPLFPHRWITLVFSSL